MTKTCYIMRGLPGSGKSTLAKEIVAKSGAKIVSADHYFLVDGVYKFHLEKLPAAHATAQKIAQTFFKAKVPAVIIDNCNVKYDHMDPYITAALEEGYEIRLVEPNTKWRYDLEICKAMTSHQVPAKQMEAMQRDWMSSFQVLKQIKAAMKSLEQCKSQKRIAKGN